MEPRDAAVRRNSLFLSYTARDRDLAEVVGTILDGHELEIWADWRSMLPGQSIKEKLRAALHDCAAFVILVTEHSIASKWVLCELGAAWALHKPIVPIVRGVAPQQLPPLLFDLVVIPIEAIQSRLVPHLYEISSSLPIRTAPSGPNLFQLAEEAAIAAGYAEISSDLAALVAAALSDTRDLRRHAHRCMRSASHLVRKACLDIFRSLTTSDNPRIRGEAYYSLGDIHLQPGAYACKETDLRSGLSDASLFVRACCANVLMNFSPLSTSTIADLKRCLDTHAHQTDTDAQSLTYYSSRTLAAQPAVG